MHLIKIPQQDLPTGLRNCRGMVLRLQKYFWLFFQREIVLLEGVQKYSGSAYEQLEIHLSLEECFYYDR